MVNVSIDLATEQLSFIEKLVKQGRYRTRSEAVRDFIRRGEFDLSWNNALRENKDKKINIEEAREKASKNLLKEFEAHAIVPHR